MQSTALDSLHAHYTLTQADADRPNIRVRKACMEDLSDRRLKANYLKWQAGRVFVDRRRLWCSGLGKEDEIG